MLEAVVVAAPAVLILKGVAEVVSPAVAALDPNENMPPVFAAPATGAAEFEEKEKFGVWNVDVAVVVAGVAVAPAKEKVGAVVAGVAVDEEVVLAPNEKAPLPPVGAAPPKLKMLLPAVGAAAVVVAAAVVGTGDMVDAGFACPNVKEAPVVVVDAAEDVAPEVAVPNEKTGLPREADELLVVVVAAVAAGVKLKPPDGGGDLAAAPPKENLGESTDFVVATEVRVKLEVLAPGAGAVVVSVFCPKLNPDVGWASVLVFDPNEKVGMLDEVVATVVVEIELGVVPSAVDFKGSDSFSLAAGYAGGDEIAFPNVKDAVVTVVATPGADEVFSGAPNWKGLELAGACTLGLPKVNAKPPFPAPLFEVSTSSFFESVTRACNGLATASAGFSFSLVAPGSS